LHSNRSQFVVFERDYHLPVGNMRVSEKIEATFYGSTGGQILGEQGVDAIKSRSAIQVVTSFINAS